MIFSYCFNLFGRLAYFSLRSGSVSDWKSDGCGFFLHFFYIHTLVSFCSTLIWKKREVEKLRVYLFSRKKKFFFGQEIYFFLSYRKEQDNVYVTRLFRLNQLSTLLPKRLRLYGAASKFK